MAERLKKAAIKYIDSKGNETRSPTADWQTIRTTFAGELEGTVIDAARSSFNADILSCASAQGIAIKLQRADPEAKTVGLYFEGHASVLEQLQAGAWLGESEKTGPRITDLLEAVIMVKHGKAGATDEQRETYKSKLLTEEGRTVAKKSAKVMAYVEQFKADRATARAKDARAAAKVDEGEFTFD